MKINILFLSTILLLAGCSTPHKVFKDHDHLPVRQETGLVGKSAQTVKASLGAPLMVRTEKPNQIWTYRQNQCTTLVYFDKNEQVCFAESRGECPRTIALNTTNK